MSRYVIGDIHGGFKAVNELFKLVQLNIEDTLIFLGDYVDGWSESAMVIEYLIMLDLKYNCIFLNGNHDNWCRDWLKTNHTNSTWLFNGGAATIDSYNSFSESEKLLHLNFFEKMKDFYVDENKNLFIHAGFSSMHGPEKEHHHSNYFWDRTLWETALSLDINIDKESVYYPKRLFLFNEIFIGHTPTTNYNCNEPMHKANVWNIDTGAAYEGKLTILNIDTKEFWQSSQVNDLYPKEKGRNK